MGERDTSRGGPRSYGPRSYVERLGTVWAPEGAALDLAVIRITVACVLSLSTSIAVAPEWAALPVAARTVPWGVGWLVPWLPIDPETVSVVRVIFHVACVLGALGLFTRVSWVIVALTTFFLLLVPQLGGAVFHDHHLLWLAVILAASPCGDALSLDARFFDRGRSERGHAPRPTHSRTHGLSVRLCWLVIGLVFFFPGVHKLASAGLDWALSDNLRNQMWWKWAQDPALQPALRIDRHPWVMHALGLWTIAFELTFLPLVFAPRTRALAVMGALAFHAGTDHFMGIQFSALWATYTMFVPWQALLDRARGHAPDRPLTGSLAGAAPLCCIAAPLVGGIVLLGVMGEMQAYPFACYPTFQWLAPDHMPALEISTVGSDGRTDTLDRSLVQEPGPRGWALSWRLAGVYGDFDAGAFDAWWDEVSCTPRLVTAVEGATAIRASRVSISIDPDAPQRIVARTTLRERPPPVCAAP